MKILPGLRDFQSLVLRRQTRTHQEEGRHLTSSYTGVYREVPLPDWAEPFEFLSFWIFQSLNTPLSSNHLSCTYIQGRVLVMPNEIITPFSSLYLTPTILTLTFQLSQRFKVTLENCGSFSFFLLVMGICADTNSHDGKLRNRFERKSE